MFNLQSEVQRLSQFGYAKIHGLPYKPRQQNPAVSHVDGTLFELKAEQEHKFMLRRFRNHSMEFGRRLSKRRGQYHKPGGGFAGCIMKGR